MLQIYLILLFLLILLLQLQFYYYYYYYFLAAGIPSAFLLPFIQELGKSKNLKHAVHIAHFLLPQYVMAKDLIG